MSIEIQTGKATDGRLSLSALIEPTTFIRNASTAVMGEIVDKLARVIAEEFKSDVTAAIDRERILLNVEHEIARRIVELYLKDHKR